MFTVFAVATALMWFISPVGLILIACVLEGRWISLRPPTQFAAFFPGDLFLGIGVGGLAAAAWRMSSQYILPSWMELVVVVSAVCVGCFMGYKFHKNECEAAYAGEIGAYKPEAMWTPSKLYHNLGVFTAIGAVAFGSVLALGGIIATTDASMLGVLQAVWPLLVASIVGFLLWGVCFMYDARAPRRYAEGAERNAFLRRRADACHPAPSWASVSPKSHLFEEPLQCDSSY